MRQHRSTFGQRKELTKVLLKMDMKAEKIGSVTIAGRTFLEMIKNTSLRNDRKKLDV